MIMNVLISSLSLADSVTKPKMFCKMNEGNVFLFYMSATLFQKFNFKKYHLQINIIDRLYLEGFIWRILISIM